MISIIVRKTSNVVKQYAKNRLLCCVTHRIFYCDLFKGKCHFKNCQIRFYTPRNIPEDNKEEIENSKTLMLFFVGFTIMMFGLYNIMIPVYRRYCQYTYSSEYVKRALTSVGVVPDPTRKIRVRFRGTASPKLCWDFEPTQEVIEVIIGEPALAFFKAKNNGSEPLVGISTYSLDPVTAGNYFYKIQCFCFEEQRLDPGDEVLMPIFFYIDPKFDEISDNMMTDEVILSYNFYLSINNDFVNREVEEFKGHLNSEVSNDHLPSIQTS
ncbi:Cytochrome c oxidase assembly protein COX11, mitochondrial [Thelohanellus kitauei]|uniref:Cytochrome c oxidase assembly protein COX11, mitochondrial n=1 Tax=Thelohanellus kitauei TaxID=669202 RepID=A0A0C2M6L5_THEKT|nr:Cytochrome c oxidase assembly protein COX11, mitochondrial [Thelohanellus kitauei]